LFFLSQGVCLCLHRAFREWAESRPRLDAALRTPAGTALRVALTFVSFTCLLTIFRSPTVDAAGTFLGRMFSFVGAGRHEPFNLTLIGVLIGVVAAGHYLAAGDRWRRWLGRVPPQVQGVGFALAMTLAMVLAPGAGKTFIYFQF